MEEYTREVIDLKNLVTRTLEKKGVLAKIRAQLRASVFEAIKEEDQALENENGIASAFIGSCNARAKQLHASSSGKLMSALICEYMDWAQLGHTLKVYLPECNLPRGFWKSELREKFGAKFESESRQNRDSQPLLMEVIEMYLKLENSTRNSLNENARFTFSAAESASTSGQDEPSSNVESQSHRPSSPLSGGLPPLGRKGGLSPINQSFVGSLQNFSLTSATANHLTDADSSGTSRENGYLPASEKQDHEWKYDDEGYSEEAHSEDVLRAANTLENIHSERKSHSLTSSWRRSTQMSLDDDTSDGNIEELIEEEVPSERESS